MYVKSLSSESDREWYTRAYAEYQKEISQYGAETFDEKNANVYIFQEKENGKNIGFASVTPVAPPSYDEHWCKPLNINAVYVVPEYRRKTCGSVGLFSIVVREFKENIPNKTPAILTAEVPATNRKAVNFLVDTIKIYDGSVVSYNKRDEKYFIVAVDNEAMDDAVKEIQEKLLKSVGQKGTALTRRSFVAQFYKYCIERSQYTSLYPTPATVYDAILRLNDEKVYIQLHRQKNTNIGFSVYSTEKGTSHIREFYIAPPYRGKGIGTEIVQSWLETQPPENMISFEVLTGNNPALKFWKSVFCYTGYTLQRTKTSEGFEHYTAIPET